MTPLELAIAWLCGAAICAASTCLVFSGQDLAPEIERQVRLVERVGYAPTGLALVLLLVREVVR